MGKVAYIVFEAPAFGVHNHISIITFEDGRNEIGGLAAARSQSPTDQQQLPTIKLFYVVSFWVEKIEE